MADLRRRPWDAFSVECAPRDRISDNFRFYELSGSETAERGHEDDHGGADDDSHEIAATPLETER